MSIGLPTPVNLTQEELKELLRYDFQTGDFTWIVTRKGHIKEGTVAGCLDGKGYLRIGINYKMYAAHRLAFLYMEGYWPENGIDHLDRNTQNNSWCNLRETSQSCNVKNSKVSSRNSSGVIGVSFHKGRQKWEAYISLSNKRRQHLGWFDSIRDAVVARYHAELINKYYTCSTQSSAKKYLDSPIH